MLKHHLCIIGGLVTLMCLLTPPLAWPAEQIAVYYPTTLSAKARQDLLKEKTGKDQIDFVVFAKFKDFMDDVQARQPKVVIAPSSFAKFNKGYKPVLQFAENNGPDFSYMLLALDSSWNKGNLGQGKAGIVEEVNREHLKDYINELLGASPKLVRSVSKAEDLFPLLVFKSVDFIILSPANYNQLKQRFTVNVVNVVQSKPVKGTTVYVNEKEAENLKPLIEKLKGLPSDVLSGLGFAKVEAPGEVQ